MPQTANTPTVSPTQEGWLRQSPHTLKRHLLFEPIVEHGRAIVTGTPSVDPTSGGIYQFRYGSASGTPTDAEEGEVILIGTTPGARDIGVVRMRKNISDTNLVSINEVSQGEVPIAAGAHVTWLRQRKIMQRRVRRVPTDEFGVDYTEYVDYDIPYSGQNQDNTPPIGNITGEAGQASKYKIVGRLDAGQDYRTVPLSYGSSFSPRLQNIDGQFFLDPGCSFAPGYDGTSNPTYIRVPLGCVRVKLVVSNEENLGDGFRYINLYTLPEDPADDEDVINHFVVTRDDTSEGRSMDFTIFDSAMPDGVLPKGTQVVYWEEEVDFNGNPVFDAYRDAFMGWTIQDAVPFRRHHPIYKIKVEGPAGILAKLGGFPQTWYDPRSEDEPTASADKFVEIPRNYPDYTIYKIIWTYTNALELMNFFASDIIVPIEGVTTGEGSVWSQINSIVERYFGTAICDSLGSLFLVRYFSYLPQADRDLIDPIITIDDRYWNDKQPPEIIEDQYNKVAQLDIYGSNFDIIVASGGDLVDFSHVWRVNAPGITQSDGISYESYTSVFLKTTQAGLQELKDLAGHHYARLNNKLSDVTVQLKGNMDIAEVAWGRPIAMDYHEENSRGIEFTNKLFMIKSISIQHNFEVGQPPKEITWSLEAVTFGLPGEEVLVKQRAVIEPYPEVKPIFLSDQDTIIAVQEERRFIYTNNFKDSVPLWTQISLTGLLPTGVIKDFEPDPYSPYYLGTGIEVNGWMVFKPSSGNLRIYYVEDILGAISLTLQFTSPTATTTTPATIKTERREQNFVVMGFMQAGVAYICRTTDGTNWTQATVSGASVLNSFFTELHISPNQDGVVYAIFAIDEDAIHSDVWMSSDYGAIFDELVPNVVHPLQGPLHVPKQSTDDSIVFVASESGAGVYKNITLLDTDLGEGDLQVSQKFSIKTCDIDMNAVIIAGGAKGCLVTFDDFATITRVDNDVLLFTSGNIAGDDPKASFWWSYTSGNIGYSYNGATILDKRGSGGTAFPTGTTLNIFGGPPP